MFKMHSVFYLKNVYHVIFICDSNHLRVLVQVEQNHFFLFLIALFMRIIVSFNKVTKCLKSFSWSLIPHKSLFLIFMVRRVSQ